VRAMLPRCEITFVSTYDQAVAALKHNQYGSVVITMRFDESRMFSLLEHIRATYPETPVTCVRTGPSKILSKVIHAAAAMAVGLMGAQAFFDLKDEGVRQKDPMPIERSVRSDSAENDPRR